jgi:hypothetical protein
VASAAGSAYAPAPDPQRTLAWLESSLLDGEVSKQTHDAIVGQIEAHNGAASAKSVNSNGKKQPPLTTTGTMAGLLLGSPEFQRK